MQRIYFKGLTEIRAIAALFVVFHHIELYKYREGLNSLYETKLEYFIEHLGKNGVYVFFVLSGFLITYLLLSEKQFKGRVHIRKFYFRRILRIWPLYYLIVFISFAIIPLIATNFDAFRNEEYYYSNILLVMESPWETLLLYLFFLPNLALFLKPPVVGASQAWSVGVEEQFYAVWPHLINLISRPIILTIVFLVIACLPVYPVVLASLSPSLSSDLSFISKLIPIHFMALGGIGALGLFYMKEKLTRFLRNPFLFVINTAVFVLLLAVDVGVPFKQILLGGVIMIEILFVIQEGFRLNLRSKMLEKLGDISYGIYMYHPMVMLFVFTIINSLIPSSGELMYNICIYSGVIITTLIVSNLSFNYFEKRFLSLKDKKFSVIKSGSKVSEKA